MVLKTGALGSRGSRTRGGRHGGSAKGATSHLSDPGYAIVRWRSWTSLPSAMGCRCGRAMGWPSARQSQSAAKAMPTNSTGRGVELMGWTAPAERHRVPKVVVVG